MVGPEPTLSNTILVPSFEITVFIAASSGSAGTRRYSTRRRTRLSSTIFLMTTTPQDQQDMAEEGRSIRKRRAIVEAAEEVFLSNGYVGTSMDEIAARASVSKQTVYK